DPSKPSKLSTGVTVPAPVDVPLEIPVVTCPPDSAATSDCVELVVTKRQKMMGGTKVPYICRGNGAFAAMSGLQVEEERACVRKLPKDTADHCLWLGQPEDERARFREMVRELWGAEDRREEEEREERRREKVERRRERVERRRLAEGEAKEELVRREAERIESQLRTGLRYANLFGLLVLKVAPKVTHQQRRQRYLLRAALVLLRAAKHQEEAWRLQVAVTEAEDQQRKLDLWKGVMQGMDMALRGVDGVGYPFEQIAARLKGLCLLRLATISYSGPLCPPMPFTRWDSKEFMAALCELDAAAGFGDASVRKVAPEAYRTWCINFLNLKDEAELDPVVIVSAIRGPHCIGLEREKVPRVVLGQPRTGGNLFGWGLFAWAMMDEIEKEYQLLRTGAIDGGLLLSPCPAGPVNCFSLTPA
ncbi:hypothetical protein EDD11_010407, partial [Mortierella claussenii]